MKSWDGFLKNRFIPVNYFQLISLLSIFCFALVASQENTNVPCNCAVYMSGQFKKGSNEQPKGSPALLNEQDVTFPCTNLGTKLCINKCLDSIVKFLPNAPKLICGAVDRDLFKERAYLFVQNCSPQWVNSNLAAGKEFCCKDGEPYKCGFAPKA